MDALLLLRCQNLQRGIDALGSADVFLQKYSDFFGADQAVSSNHLFKLLSGKIAIRADMARAFEQVLQKPSHWLDQVPTAGAGAESFGAWPRAASGEAYQRLSGETQRQLKADADELVEQWSSVDWRHVQVLKPKK